MKSFKEYADQAFNWSGGTYVGLSTLVILGLAIADFVKNGKAPEWFVGTVGIYTVILGLFVMKQPIASLGERIKRKNEDKTSTG